MLNYSLIHFLQNHFLLGKSHLRRQLFFVKCYIMDFYRIISLGSDCSVAGSLRNLKYKDTTHVFDWCVTSLEYIIECFNSRFGNFSHIINSCTKSGDKHLKYKNLCYFRHYPKVISNQLIDTFVRRGKRMDALLNYCIENKQPLLFVRKGQTDSIANIHKLIQTIQQSYKGLSFKIVVCNNIKESSSDNNILHYFADINAFLRKQDDIYYHRDDVYAYNVMYKIISNYTTKQFK